MRYTPEYILCRQVAYYLRSAYPKILFHFDSSGLFHTKTQAGQMKMIQGKRGYPYLFIMEPRNGYSGLFIELKKEGERITNKKGFPTTPHIEEQFLFIAQLNIKGYKAVFGIGFDDCKKIIDKYLTI